MWPCILARLEDPGLTILPAHRALFNLTDFNPKRFEDDLNRYFNIERIDFDKKSERARTGGQSWTPWRIVRTMPMSSA